MLGLGWLKLTLRSGVTDRSLVEIGGSNYRSLVELGNWSPWLRATSKLGWLKLRLRLSHD